MERNCITCKYNGTDEDKCYWCFRHDTELNQRYSKWQPKDDVPDINVGKTTGEDRVKELIYKEDAIKALGEEPMVWTDSDSELADRNRWETDVEALEALPTATDELLRKIEEGIKATTPTDEYSIGMRNGMRWCKSLLDDKAPEYDIVPQRYKKRRR